MTVRLKNKTRTKTGQVACKTYQALVWGQQHCDSCVDFADGQGDKHGCRENLAMEFERGKRRCWGRGRNSAVCGVSGQGIVGWLELSRNPRRSIGGRYQLRGRVLIESTRLAGKRVQETGGETRHGRKERRAEVFIHREEVRWRVEATRDWRL